MSRSRFPVQNYVPKKPKRWERKTRTVHPSVVLWYLPTGIWTVIIGQIWKWKWKISMCKITIPSKTNQIWIRNTGYFRLNKMCFFPVFRIRVFFRIQLFFLSPDPIRKNPYPIRKNPDPIRKNPDRIQVHEKNVLKSLKLYVQVENLFISYLALSTLSFLVRLLQNLVKNIIYNSLVCSWTDWIRVLKFGYETLLFSASIILSQTIALCNLMCL